MTDKQIKKYCNGLCDVCDELGIYNEEPCIYKIANELEEKLLCKEQEYNKLYIQLKADEEYYKEEKNTLREIIKNKEKRNIELYKENNKLKVKNDELKEKVKELRQGWINCDNERNLQEANSEFRQRVADRDEQKLERIKQVCKDYCKIMCSCETKETCKSCTNTEILQIIDEAE